MFGGGGGGGGGFIHDVNVYVCSVTASTPTSFCMPDQ